MWPPNYVINSLLSLMHIWESKKKKKKSLEKRWRCVLLSQQERVYKILSLRFTFYSLGPFYSQDLSLEIYSVPEHLKRVQWSPLSADKNNKNSNTWYRNLKTHSIWDHLIGARVLQPWVEAGGIPVVQSTSTTDVHNDVWLLAERTSVKAPEQSR